MQKLFLELATAISLTLAAILASVSNANAADIMLTDAYARASATPVAKSGAVYVTIMNHGAEADRLLAVATPAAAMAEVHATSTVDGVMKMEASGALEIPAMATLEMQPGGLHIMLMGLTEPLKKGGSIELKFTFEKAGEVTVKAPIGGVAAGAHDHDAGSSGG